LVIEELSKPVVSRTSPAQQIECTTKTDTRSGTGFEKHVTQDGAFKYPRHSSTQGVGLHGIRHVEDTLDISTFKLFNGENMGAGKVHEWSSAVIRTKAVKTVDRAVTKQPGDNALNAAILTALL
jgi:hypothetical protein